MLPHNTTRGSRAYNRLRGCEGLPRKLIGKTRKVVPRALAALRLKASTRVC